MKFTPQPTMRRIPHYLHLLKRLKESGSERVSSTIIANELSLDPTQVRKDLEYTGVKGKPKTGFIVTELIDAIHNFLNWNSQQSAFLVGAGHLGLAMLGYKRFKDYGLNFIAAFDNDEEKIGKEFFNTRVYSVDEIPALAKKMDVKIGVITVPASAAQNAAELLVEGGVQAIWNFAPTSVRVPKDVIVENAQFTESLAALSRKLIEAPMRD